ncbi:ABC transporter permease [Corynebacterium diphtheriae]|nr:ABC transporter permease [Corynebacterium diphtheriae]
MQEQAERHNNETLEEMVARITNTDTTADEPSQSKTLAAAWADLVRGFSQRELWLQLGWQDIKQRYRRSVLGPLWITIATGVMALALGLLYSVLFKIPVAQFLPHVTVGLIMWNFIAGCIKEGSEVFIANEGLIKQLPSALSVHVYRLVWKQTLFLMHNMVIWVILMAIFPRPLGWDILLGIPALALLIANGVWVTMFFGIVATRYRDFSPLLEALTQLLFYVTPIVWTTETLYSQGGAVSERAKLAMLNPLYHYMEVIRAPLIGAPIPPLNWIVVGCCTVIGLFIAMLAMRQWRFRVSYWV